MITFVHLNFHLCKKCNMLHKLSNFEQKKVVLTRTSCKFLRNNQCYSLEVFEFFKTAISYSVWHIFVSIVSLKRIKADQEGRNIFTTVSFHAVLLPVMAIRQNDRITS